MARPMTNSDRDKILGVLAGLPVQDAPTVGPCRICGYNRRHRLGGCGWCGCCSPDYRLADRLAELALDRRLAELGAKS